VFVVGTGAWTGVTVIAFAAGWVLPLFHPIVAGAITLAGLLGYRFTVIDRTQRHIRKAFGRILSPSLVERMVELNQLPTQGGELREMTVWLSDLENYATVAEALAPNELVDLLNEVYSVMSDTIEEHDGFVAQFVGDAVVAGFGVPLEDPDHARHGVEAAMACCERVAELKDRLDLPHGLNLRIRVGVSTGALLVGYIGSKRRLSYSIVGDDINLASRLEGVNKIYGSTILVNEVTKDLCGPGIAFREIDLVRVKGRDSPVRIFEPLGKSEAIEEAQAQCVQTFASALAAFRERHFDAAADKFNSLAGDDPVSKAFAERAREMAADPPPPDWDGVNTLVTK
jgi:class 3 adenylate cyclase